MIFNYRTILKKTKSNWLDAYLIILIASSILGFLSVKGWTNTCLFLILIPALIQFKTAYNNAITSLPFNTLAAITFTLALPVLAILISQLLRQDWLFKAYDAPARMFFSIPIFLYFIYKKIDYAAILSLCAPLALLILLPIAHQYLKTIDHWGGRFATPFVDPNAFGVYVLVLTAFCLFSINPHEPKKGKQLLLLLGLIAGVYLMIGSKTRGSWFGIPPLLLLWINFKLNSLNMRSTVFFILPLILLFGLFGLYLFPETTTRLGSAFSEIVSWLDNSNPDTSTGVRLSMWQVSWELYKHSPFHGYGDIGFKNHLNDPWLQNIATPYIKETIVNGPHNEFLANLLRSGTLGGLSTLCLFFIPLRLFWQNRRNQQTELACNLGIAFTTCLIFSSISIEVFTLKYTSTFYGLTIAGLASQVARLKDLSTSLSIKP